ncbi:MAG TPA: BTAD domain-containing putative transcriptional regulator [Nocardioidaceae bacterium]
MGTRVNLLGAPGITADGFAPTRPRGSKCWAALAYVVLSDRPVPRARLVDLLFDEAEDPAGALRWTLSQLRRGLGPAGDVSGDPLRWVPDEGTVVDVDVLVRGTWQEALALPGFGGELLEGVAMRVGPAFELWLAGERRRLSATTAAMLHEATHDRLAQGETAAAVELAMRLVACNALDERGHELLVRSLVAAGEPDEAAARARACEELFRRELGRAPSSALRAALSTGPPVSVPRSRSAVLAAIDVGESAAQAGAYDRAIDLLREAVAAEGDIGEEVNARALAALGTVLVHGVRGSDEEAVTLLHRAHALAKRCGAREVAARAAHELGVVETLRGHYPRMEAWFTEATALADGDERLLAWTNLYAGIGRTDQAEYASAEPTLRRAIEMADRVGDQRASAYAATGLGRLHLLRGELGPARRMLESAVGTTRRLGWTAFLAFPQSLLATVDLLEGREQEALDGLERAYATACHVGDPCWESYALRGQGLVAAARGDDDAALRLLREATRSSRRLPDTHAWVDGYCLEALCGFAVEHSLPEAPAWIDELEDFASRRGMRELTLRAVLHRDRLGQAGAGASARMLLAEVDNPALQRASTSG